uniref:Uncharacterized protein n=1 Tax=Fundulus heteroclitus TaxID=8078 RepID=A0A3Q2PUX1_FUNHE
MGNQKSIVSLHQSGSSLVIFNYKHHKTAQPSYCWKRTRVLCARDGFDFGAKCAIKPRTKANYPARGDAGKKQVLISGWHEKQPCEEQPRLQFVKAHRDKDLHFFNDDCSSWRAKGEALQA